MMERREFGIELKDLLLLSLALLFPLWVASFLNICMANGGWK